MDPQLMDAQLMGEIGKGGTVKKKGGKSLSTFFKKNMTMTRHFVLQAVGKADQLEFPLLCEQESTYLKYASNHYKEMERVVKRLTKNTSALESDEHQLGEIMKRYARHLEEEQDMREREDELLASVHSNNNNSGSGGGGGLLQPPGYDTANDGDSLEGRQFFARDDERRKINSEVIDDLGNMSTMFSEFGETFQSISGLRTELTERVSNSYLPTLVSMLDDANVCRETKERYRQALSLLSAERTKLRTLRQKSNDLVKIGNAEKDYAEAKRRSELEYEDMMDEYEYNIMHRNMSYMDTIKDVVVAYRLYFARGAEMLAELEDTLKLQTARRRDLERKPKRYQPVRNVRMTPSKQAEERFRNQKIYGVDLEEVMQRGVETGEVPHIFQYLIDFIEKHGARVEGIFRISGDAIEISICKKKVDKGLPLELDPGTQTAVHNAASLLKQYIRELPDPLLTFDKYSAFTQASQLPDGEGKIRAFKTLLEDLPVYNALMLNSLCELLGKVEQYSEENKMTFANLAIVFGMNIVHPEDTSNPLTLIQDSKKMNDTCQYLLEHYNTEFRPILASFRNKIPEKKSTDSPQELHDEMDTFLQSPLSADRGERRFLPPPTAHTPAAAFSTGEKPSRPLPPPPMARGSLPRPPAQSRAFFTGLQSMVKPASSATPPPTITTTATTAASSRGRALPPTPSAGGPARSPSPRHSLLNTSVFATTQSNVPKMYPRMSSPSSTSSTHTSSFSGQGDITYNDEYFSEVNPYETDVHNNGDYLGIYPAFNNSSSSRDDDDEEEEEDLLQY